MYVLDVQQPLWCISRHIVCAAKWKSQLEAAKSNRDILYLRNPRKQNIYRDETSENGYTCDMITFEARPRRHRYPET